MRKLIILFLVAAAVAQDITESFECPIPGNPPASSVTNAICDLYTACIFTNGACHMRRNAEAGYVVSSAPDDTGRGFKVTLDKADPTLTLFGADVSQLTLEVIQHQNYHLQIKIYDPANTRYEVPLPLILPATPDDTSLYTVTVSDVGQPLNLTVTRNSNGASVFQTEGPLSFEDQFLQITTALSSSYLYGIGEHFHASLRHDFDQRQTYSIFPRDQPTVVDPANLNEYGTHPYFINVEDEEGNTHSVFLYNSNAMEYSTFLMNDGTPAVTMRSIGGILDFHIFLGPAPEDVNIQYAKTVGASVFPPYWMFGFQLSRWGYDSSDNYRIVRDRMRAAGIPQDVQVFDIDYMSRYRDFTYDSDNWADFPALIQELHDENIKVILILDPAIVIDWDNYAPAQRGRDNDVFIKWPSDLIPDDQADGANDFLVGYVWPDTKTVFPDFFKNETISWWVNEIQLLKEQLDFDGLWIDMNEPANFGTNLDKPWNWPLDQPDWSLKCPVTTLDDPVYPTLAASSSLSESQRLSDKTICMSALQTNGETTFNHYDVHSLYGITETIATTIALQTIFPGFREVVLTRSTFPGSGRMAVHWLGDNDADWEQLRRSIIGLMEFNMFAINFVGADVCGFFNEPDEELCIRWMQAGAFYPFDRNHNTNGTAPQDPANPEWDLAPVISRDVLLLRYQYIPFFYARFHRAEMNGYSVIRPLFNVFPSDVLARDIDDQFLWSDALMVAPVMTQGALTRDVYFPEGLWYDLVSGTLEATGPTTLTVDAPLEKIPVYVRGGSILPYQEPALTTEESRKNPFGYTIALDDSFSATGEVFYDDGLSKHVMSETFIGNIIFSNNVLTLEVRYDPTPADGINLETIQVYGYPSNPNTISINGGAADPSSWTFDALTNVLILNLSVPVNEALEVTFN